MRVKTGSVKRKRRNERQFKFSFAKRFSLQPSPTFKPRSLEIGLNQRSRLPKIVISVSSIPPSSSLAAGTAATTIPPV